MKVRRRRQRSVRIAEIEEMKNRWDGIQGKLACSSFSLSHSLSVCAVLTLMTGIKIKEKYRMHTYTNKSHLIYPNWHCMRVCAGLFFSLLYIIIHKFHYVAAVHEWTGCVCTSLIEFDVWNHTLLCTMYTCTWQFRKWNIVVCFHWNGWCNDIYEWQAVRILRIHFYCMPFYTACIWLLCFDGIFLWFFFCLRYVLSLEILLILLK